MRTAIAAVLLAAGVALMAACTLGLGLAIEPAVRLSRAAATQLGAGVTLPNGTTSAGASGTVP